MASQQTRMEKQGPQPEGKDASRSPQQGTLARSSSSPINLITPMGFSRMNPFSLMTRMMEEMDRVFGDGGLAREAGGAVLWSPAIEVSEREGNYVVRAELPGLKPEDVKLEVENDALVLQGERKYEHQEERGDMRRTEIRYGQFYRAIPLPEGAKVDQAHAKFEKGVLEVTVPVPKQETQRKQIPIQTASANAA